MLEEPHWLEERYQIYALIGLRDQTTCSVGVSNDVSGERRVFHVSITETLCVYL